MSNYIASKASQVPPKAGQSVPPVENGEVQ